RSREEEDVGCAGANAQSDSRSSRQPEKLPRSSTWAAIRRRMPRCIISHAIPDCVTMYDGTQLPLACKVTIPVEFGDVVADTEFLVTVSDCENLLGVSFMREHCQNLDFAQGMLTFNNGTCIPVRYSHRELQNCRVYTSEKCTLPLEVQRCLPSDLDDGHPENRGSPSIVELVKSRLHPSCNALEAAPALMTMPEGRGYIEVVNTDSEVFLQAGIRVGVATPLRTADLMYLSETPEPELNHRKGKDHANADALSRRPEGPPIFFEHGRLLEQPGSTARPVHSRCLEAKTDLDEDLEATAPAAFQHDAHRCSQRLETGLDDNSEATATTALCRDAHSAYRNLETNLDEDLEATVSESGDAHGPRFKGHRAGSPSDDGPQRNSRTATLMLEKTHPILTTTEPTATAACDEACFTCCVPPYSQESPVLCSGGMRAAPSAESSVMRAMKRTSIRDQRTYADVVRQSPSERPNPDADKTVPCDRPGAIKAETAGIRTPQPCRAVLTDFLKLPMTRQQFVEAQRADRAISYVLNLVKDEAPKPEFDARLRLTKEQRNLLGYYENLQEDNGLLLIDLSDGQQPPKVVLPEALDAQVLQELHSSPLCGHLGETKTLLRLRERFWRPGLARATKTFISKCRTCLESKSRRRERVPVQSFPVCEVLGRIHCDVVGPIAQKSKSGNRYILTLCDATSKYPFAYPMRNQKAKTKLPEYADLPDYVKDFQRRLDEATELAKERLHLHQQLRDEHYSNLPAATKLQPGDLVFLNNPVLEPDEAAKFHRPRKALYEVVEPKGEVVYKIRRRLPNPRARRDELVVHRRNLLLVPDADYTRTSDPEPGGDLLIRTPCSLICKSARCAEFVDLFISFRREAHLIEGRDLKELPTALSRTTSASDYDEFNMFNERDESRCSSRLDQHISSSRPAAADAAAAAAAINDFGQQPTPRRGARSDVSDDPPDELLQGLDNIGRNITHQDVRTMMAALQQQMERPVSKQVKIVKFTPSQDIHVWLAAFEQRCEMERIVDPFEMKQHLIASLDLATAYPSLLGMNLPRFASYEEVKQRLIERFARHGGADEYRELLRRRQQGKNESAEEFADALRTLGERAYPRMHPEDREKEITDQFLAGIRTTPDLRERLYWVRPNNLLAAIRELRRLEGAKELAHRSAQPPVRMLDGEEDGDPKPDVTAQALLTLTDLIEKQQRMLDHLVQRDQQQVASPPKRAIICYSCGQPGHRNTQCPMRQNQGNGQAESDNGTALREVQAQATWQIQNGREKKRMSAAQAPMPSPTVALSDAECGGFVDTSPNQKIHAREADPYVTGRVASREVPFLLDSGSRKNFLGSSTWAAIRRRMPRDHPVEFGDVVADTEFLVTVSDCENLLGVSFMREHCQNLDFAQGMLTFNNGTCIPVRYSRRELQNCRVYTSEKCTLPPRSSALLAVRLDDGHPENRGSPSIVELVKSRLHPSCNALEAAPALMTMPEGRGYIEVVNTADSEVFLQAGIRVGVATPLRTADLMYLSETPEPELNHRKGKDHANADALSRRPEGPPIFFEHGRLLEQPGSTARPGDDHDLEPDLDPTPEATARAALQKTVHSRCLEAKTDLDEDLEATAPAAFQHDAHRCSQRLETGLDDNSEATATTALCRDAHAAYRNLETNLDEDLEATVNTDLLDDAQDLRSRNLETPTDQDSKATAPAALLMTARNATPGQQLKYNPPEPFAEISRHVDRGQNLAPAARSKLCPPGRQTAAHRLCGKSSPPLRHRPVLEKTHPILTTTEPTATAACDEACFTCCVPPYSQESPVLCSGGMRAAPSAESSVMRAMKRTSIRDQRTYADVVRQSPSERPNPDADKTVPCDRPGAIKAETAGIRTPQPCRAVLTDFLKLPMTRQQFVEAQRADRAISYVLNLVKDEAPKPEFDARLRLTKEQRNLLGYYENLQEDNGLLLIDLSDGQQPPKVVLPEALDAQVLQELHSSPLCGHLGETKTLLRLRERFWRPGLARATKTFISKCRTCLESKSRRRERVPVQSFPVCEVLGRIHCDVVGPIAQKSKSGNRYILTLCDATSKYPFAYPMRNQKAKTVIKLLQERFIPDVHPVTGFTPHYLVFGRDFRLPIDNALKKLPEYADLPDYVKDFQRRLDEATELAKERLHLHQQLRDEHYSNLPAAKKLQPGDLVFLNNPVLEPDEAAKFHRPRKALYEVVEPKGEVVYKIRRRLPNPRARRDELVVHRRNLLLVPDADYTRTSDPEPGGDLLIRTPCSLICKSARCAEFVDLFISFRREAHLIEGRDLKELIIFCTLNTHKIDMDRLLGGQIGLDDFLFAHVKGQKKEVEVIKSDDALGLTITDNGAGFAFIKRIKPDSVADQVEHILPGDHIEKIDGESFVGKRHFDVAKRLKEIPRGATFVLRLISPEKSPYANLQPRGGSRGHAAGAGGGLGSGKKTIRLKAKGAAVEEDAPDQAADVAIQAVNRLIEGLLGISDAELAQNIWELGREIDNPHDFALAVDRDLGEFAFPDGLVFDFWGAISDAKAGRLKSATPDDGGGTVEFTEEF
uniref:Integrase_H2C2 domain-containing protein n=5 Tax=Macrostomum lignano TaxID=282301 RepID=A0A1I8JC16_9PLAT